MRYLFSLLFVFISAISFAQKEFHVFPVDGEIIAGTPDGNGSLSNPWDLQTALLQSSERVNGGDIIWIHEGIYNGRFKAGLRSTTSKFITVSAFKDDKVVLNGNVEAKGDFVLEVQSSKVIFRNFEVTYLGDFPRLHSDKDIKGVTGLNHRSGECKFQNLIIYNIPGLGFGSWKHTGGSIIEDCIIYNNGIIGKKRGVGEGMYVQNNSDNTRIIRNNIIFNNYYKGIEVWSASSGGTKEFIKNITLSNNIIFNNGIPSGRHQGNVIVATNDKGSVNIAKHIKVENNVLYHNVDFIKNNKLGDASSLLIGFIAKALVEDVTVTDNVIIGQNNGFSILHAKSMRFENNTVYTGYVHLKTSTLPSLESQLIKMNNNRYFTKGKKAFRILKYKDYSLKEWQNTFKIDDNSSQENIKNFEINPVLKVTPFHSNALHYNVALLEKNGHNITVDFEAYNIEKGMTYKIYDIENKSVVVKSGTVEKDLKIEFPMALKEIEMPLQNTLATKSANNFGVFRIEFEKPEKKSFFKRFFGWLF